MDVDIDVRLPLACGVGSSWCCRRLVTVVARSTSAVVHASATVRTLQCLGSVRAWAKLGVFRVRAFRAVVTVWTTIRREYVE